LGILSTSILVISASLVTPILFDIGMTLSRVSFAGMIREVPFTVHFFLLCSCTNYQALFEFISSFLILKFMKLVVLAPEALSQLGFCQVVDVKTFGTLEPSQFSRQF
jgi:hypothetical protein